MERKGNFVRWINGSDLYNARQLEILYIYRILTKAPFKPFSVQLTDSKKIILYCSVFEFRAWLTSLLSRSVMNSQLSSNYAMCWQLLERRLPLDDNPFTLVFGEDRLKNFTTGKCFQSSKSRSRTRAQTQCRECHNGTSWILKRAAKWKRNRSNGNRC